MIIMMMMIRMINDDNNNDDDDDKNDATGSCQLMMRMLALPWAACHTRSSQAAP